MPKDRTGNSGRGDVSRRFLDCFGQSGNGHADIGRDRVGVGVQGFGGVVSIMAHGPKFRARLCGLGEIDRAAAVIGNNVAKGRDLFAHGPVCPLKFNQQMRQLWQICATPRVEGPNIRPIHKFNPRHRQAHLDGLDNRAHGGPHIRKSTGRGHDRFRLPLQPQGQFGDQAQCPFGPHKQGRQVIAGRGFGRAAARADNASIGQHHFQPQHIGPHGPVAHCCCAACAGGRHPAKRRICTGIDRKEQSCGAQFSVQRFSRHTGLDDGDHVLGCDL